MKTSIIAANTLNNVDNLTALTPFDDVTIPTVKLDYKLMNNLSIARQILETSINAVQGTTTDHSLFETKTLLTGIVSELESSTSDFCIDDIEGGEVRVIKMSEIDQILADELENDSYILGCFNADFISAQTDFDIELVQACQTGEAYEALGNAIVKACNMIEFGQAYSNADGYGHHFAGYDHEEHEANEYYIFRTN